MCVCVRVLAGDATGASWSLSCHEVRASASVTEIEAEAEAAGSLAFA